ncbi:unnamed protein product [Adineta steineri]|uniref:Uncharacterized protein n=1 Tax=Adineta steineri TaxID=433720 RepID=A0A815YEN8_9BILA|nr:unnamed protein product [Adineta steineri]CAF1569776.1 unnamed protein product [Adineta steineri]
MASGRNETNFDPMNNLEFTLIPNLIQSSSPSEETSSPVLYDYNISESFYEIDTADLNMALYGDQLFSDILNNILEVNQLAPPSPHTDEISELLMDNIGVSNSTESNDTANPVQTMDEQLAMNKPNYPTMPTTRSHTEKSSINNHTNQSISLSESVAVTVPTPNQLILVHPLENTYKARYKSDYFPQTGNVRRPRYVSDNASNHFITLQLPAGYHRDFTHEYIRVALVTTLINNRERYYSPYKFQTNHDDAKVPDQNPIYISVKKNEEKGCLKLYLVLIKSKLDQLYDAQPLKPFSDVLHHVQNIIDEERLASKELITKYQLDKSHIAFTLCTKLPNGTYDVHPETTIISSVITETSTKPSATTTTTNNKSTAKSKPKTVSCPHCKHCFDPTDAVNATKKETKRKAPSGTRSKTTISTRANKKKKMN